MLAKEMYENYLSKLEIALGEDNFDNIDYIIEYIQSPNLDPEDREPIAEIIDEATLYLELREIDYKETALALIAEYKDGL